MYQNRKDLKMGNCKATSLKMATECLVPYAAHQRPCQKEAMLYLEWKSRKFDSNGETPVASAPPFTTIDSNGGNDGKKLNCRTTCENGFMAGIPDVIRHDLAMFLSSGDPTLLNITPDNLRYFMTAANALRHTQLLDLCRNCNNQCSDSQSFEPMETGEKCSLKNTPCTEKAPIFEIMFPRPLDISQPNQVLVMDSRNNDMHKIDVRKVTRFGKGFASCAVYKKGCPYVMISGGYGRTSQTLLKYDVVENKWSHCDDMLNVRSKHRMVFLNGNVYIIGGIGCSSVERYNLENNICQEVTKLNVSVHSPAVCVYGEDIYILGGKSFKGNVTCVQKLDTRKNEIVNLSELPFPCSGGHAIVVKDTIYYATNYGHMIKFLPKGGQSQLCSHQPYRRKHFAMFQRYHELYIFGGIRTEGPVNKSGISDSENSLVKYCTESDKWSLVHSYKDTVPVYTCCTVKYPKASPVKPFMKLFGYC